MITEQQREERRKHIGSSDIAAIFGLDPFKSAADVWASKVYELEQGNDSDAIRIGNAAEEAIVKFIADKNGLQYTTVTEALHYIAKDGIFACNLDAQEIIGNDWEYKPLPYAIEAKATSLSDEWGEEGTDNVPDRVIVQVQHQIYCAGLEYVRIGAFMSLFGRLTIREYGPIKRNQEMIDNMVKAGLDWWNKYVIPKIPPDSSVPSLKVFRSIKREPVTTTDIKHRHVKNWLNLKAMRLRAKKLEEIQLAYILQDIGDSEAGLLPDGSMITYFKQRGADKIDRQLLKEQYPEVYKEIAKPNIFRTAQIKKGAVK